MKEQEEKMSKLEVIITVIKSICAIILILLVAVLALQRFSNNEIAIGGIRIFSVATESMVPKYKVGDVLVVKEVDVDTLKVGDDITYLGKVDSFAGRVVTHQIIDIEETTEGKIYHTKGIANEIEDPTIEGDQIYGKVIYKCILISLLTKLTQNMTLFFIVVFIPFAILIFLQIKDSMDARDDEEDDEDEDDDDDEVDEEDDDDDDEVDEEDK